MYIKKCRPQLVNIDNSYPKRPIIADHIQNLIKCVPTKLKKKNVITPRTEALGQKQGIIIIY